MQSSATQTTTPKLRLSSEHSYIHIVSKLIPVEVEITEDQDTILTDKEGKKIKGPAKCVVHLFADKELDEKTVTSISNVIGLRPQQMLAYVPCGPEERIDNILAISKIRKWIFEGQITNKVADYLVDKLVEVYAKYQDTYCRETGETPVDKTLIRPVAEFYKLLIVSGIIESIMDHPEADTLFIENVDFMTEKRTIVSGLKGKFEKDKLVNGSCLFILNLKPVSFKGTKSYGMILFAKDTNGTRGSTIFTEKNGCRLELSKYPLEKLTPLRIKPGDASKRILEGALPRLSVKRGRLLYGDLETQVDGKTVTVPGIEDGTVS